MSYLLDTNTCIRYLNGESENIKARLELLSPDDLLLCSVVKAELLFGAAKGTAGERTLARLNQFFGTLKSLPFDDRSAVIYGAIRAGLERRGIPIGPKRSHDRSHCFGEWMLCITKYLWWWTRRELGRAGILRTGKLLTLHSDNADDSAHSADLSYVKLT